MLVTPRQLRARTDLRNKPCHWTAKGRRLGLIRRPLLDERGLERLERAVHLLVQG